MAALFAIAFSATASAATSGASREELSALKSRVSKLEELNKASLERNAKLETRVSTAEGSAKTLKGRLSTAESTTSALAGRVTQLESVPAPEEEPPAKEAPQEEPPHEEPPVKEAPYEEPPVKEAPHEEPVRTLHCFASPASCGYPSEATGANLTTLVASGSINASTAGQVIENKDVTGSITISAPNVTVRNVRVTATASGSGSAAITDSSTGLKVINTTVRGKGPGAQTVEAAIRDYDPFLVEGSNLTLCNECLNGISMTVKNSYLKVSSIYSGAHAEDIYFCSGTTSVEHSTLLNEQEQTATVFGDTICGGANHLSITNSLLAGGGYLLYPQSAGTGSGGQTTITGNHIARCLTSTRESNGHRFCSGGFDSNGYYPGGGSYGVGSYFSGPTTWSGNVWDDSGATVPSP